MPTKILTLIFLCVTISAHANTHQNLQQIKNQIQAVQTNLAQDQSTRTNIQKAFQQAEEDIGKVSVQLRDTQQQLAEQQQKIHELEKQQADYETQLTNEQQALAQQLRSAYMLGHEQYLKILLSQQNPNDINRQLTYYHYFVEDKLQLINNLNQTLLALNKTEADLQTHMTQLQQLQTTQEHQANALKSNKTKRAQLLQQINHDIQSKNQKLTTLMADKAALEKVMAQLQTQSTRYTLPAGVPFPQLRGKLSWPTAGKLLADYGTQVEQSELKLNGVIISAPQGQAVYAIAPGRVVYSNWLEGYGLLLIIDHGHGYMSLYGRNNSLYKKAGDYVHGGDLIATVGNSGGYNTSSLYFAIRANGVPVDPNQWCHSQTSQVHKRRA